MTLQHDEQPASGRHTLHIACAPGNERQAMEEVAALLQDAPLTATQMACLKTAVAEATMNAMEHGHGYGSEIAVEVTVDATDERVRVQIHDKGSGPAPDAIQTPDLDAKLAGAQSPRGWGLFLMKNMVDEMNVIQDGDGHTVELIVYLSSGSGGDQDG